MHLPRPALSRPLSICLALLFFLVAPPLAAELVVLGETTTIHSEILGEERPLMISLPPGYAATDARYPVFVVLDAEGRFQHTVTNVLALARMGRIPEMIVVGVGNTDRTRDLTPPWTAENRPEDRRDAIEAGGGADAFLRFLKEELLPSVDASYRTEPLRLLQGHSLGGLFAVHALTREPDLFRGILAIAPSLWWNESASVDRAAELFRERPDLEGRLYACLADEGEDMLTAFRNFEELLRYRAPAGLRWEIQYFPDEDHNSVTVPSVHRGLVHLFERWRTPRLVVDEGLEAVDRHYAALSEEYGYPIATPEAVINRMGYAALGEDPEKAVRVFRENAKRFPDSANVYDSLAEALETTGQWKEALPLYRKALKMAEESGHPNTEFYRQNYERVNARRLGKPVD